jgi:hypothetical protein
MHQHHLVGCSIASHADPIWRVLMLLPSRVGDPLVRYGQHLGRAVHAMHGIHALLTNGILRMGEEGEVVEESLTLKRVLFVINLLFCLHILLYCRDRKEHRVFQKLLHMVPHLPERLMEVFNEECMVIAELVRLFSLNLYILLTHQRFEGHIQCTIGQY